MDSTAFPAKGRPTVAVVFGGRSAEHPVSCSSAASVMRFIDRSAFNVVPIGITRTGRWVLASDDPGRWRLEGDKRPEVTAEEGPRVMAPLEMGEQFTIFEPGRVPQILGEVDVVFPVLHGAFGEDGALQGLLELANVRYVGCGILASAMGIDKHYTKLRLIDEGIAVAPYKVVPPRRWERSPDEVRADAEELGYPVFVKPARGGSSIGVRQAKTPEQLDDAIEFARQYDPKVLLEATLTGREIKCAVLGSVDNGYPETSLPCEVEMVGDGLYNFEAKYVRPDALRWTCPPANMSNDVICRLRETAARTFDALGCEGLARVDSFVQPDGSVVVNEINTMPALTADGSFAKMWDHTGLTYPELVDRLIRMALARPLGLR